MKKIFLAAVVIMGVLLAVQIRSLQAVTFLSQRSGQQNLLSELRVFQLANEDLRTQLESETKEVEDLTSKINGQALEDEMLRLRLMSGEEPVKGEGIEILLSKSVKAYWITDLIAQLVSSGAEVIAINDVRITPRTGGLRDVGTGLLIHQTFVKAPLVISAIGPRTLLHNAVAQDGGMIDRMEKAHQPIKIIVSEREEIVVPAVKP